MTSAKGFYVEPKCAKCRDSGWWYPSAHAERRNEVIPCPRCYPSDRMRRAEHAPDRLGERD